MKPSALRNAISPAALILSLMASPVAAQVSPDGQALEEDSAADIGDLGFDDGSIVVIAERIVGSVDTDVKAVDILSEVDIAALGASSVEDLLTALSPQIGSGRGRGGGRPIMLLNGRPVNDHREIMSLPPEAIVRVEIFPEEVALKFGYRPDQRVVNLILKPDYASAELEIEQGAPTQGGRYRQEYDASFTRIGPKSRFNANLEYNKQDNITEAERDIIPSATRGGDDTAMRDLQSAEDNYEATISWSKQLGEVSDFSLSGSFTQADETRMLGLQSVAYTVAADNPANTTGNAVTVNTLLPSDRGLLRTTSTSTLGVTTGVNGRLGDWNWRTTVSATETQKRTVTQTGIDPAALQAGVSNGNINPFAADPAAGLFFRSPNVANTDTVSLDARATANGTLAEMPAGAVQVTVDAQAKYNKINASQIIENATSSSGLSRERYGVSGNIDIPILDSNTGLGETLGSVSINGNAGYSDVSDFGGLISFGGGINWNLFDNFGITASYIAEEEAPSLSDLGSPILLTPSVSIYDYTRGETVLIDYISGGNPDLEKERRRDVKVTVNWQPPFVKDLSITGEYLRNRSYDVTAGFPTLTPAIEAAFGDRVTRDSDGRLTRLDARAVTYAETRSDAVRGTLSYSGGFGEMVERSGPGGMGGGPRGGPSRAGGGGARAGGPPSGGGPRMGGGAGGGGKQQAGRFFVSLSYQYQLQDQVDIGPGVPTLDLLNGDATSSASARHRANLEGGMFYKGMGLRLSGSYTGATQIDGDPLTGVSTLYYGDLAKVDVRVFMMMDERKALVDAVPFLKGSRISIGVDNIFDSYTRVVDDTGTTPIGFQRGYIDPVGRFIEIDFRKRF